eukprot:jgi/Ulvmu1/10718/UM068_0003.1
MRAVLGRAVDGGVRRVLWNAFEWGGACAVLWDLCGGWCGGGASVVDMSLAGGCCGWVPVCWRAAAGKHANVVPRMTGMNP